MTNQASPQQPNQGPSTAKIVLITLAALAAVGMGGCLLCVGIGAKAASDANAKGGAASVGASPAKAATKSNEPATAVEAKTLFDDYHANEVSADAKYKGKRLQVSGKLGGIRKDFKEDVVLDLATSNQFMSIHANVDDSMKERAATLAKGQAVTVVCEGGGMVVGTPQLNDCLIQ